MAAWRDLTDEQRAALPRTGPRVTLSASTLVSRTCNAQTLWTLRCTCGACALCEVPDLPVVRGAVLELPPDRDVVADLLYRLEDQARAMCDSDPEVSAATAGAARRLAEKIRATTGID